MFDPTKPPASLAELAQRSFAAYTAEPCLGTKDKTSGEYRYITYGAVAMRVRHFAGGLAALGAERGQRVAILSENRAGWAIADLACQMLGLISVSLFSTLPASQVATILADCGASFIFVSDAKQLAKITEIAESLPELKTVVAFDAVPDARPPESLRLLDAAELERSGEAYYEARPGQYELTWPAADRDDGATIIYTSGTTGEPKGVVLSHRNIISNLEAIVTVLKMSHEDLFLSFLPLAHVYERTAGFFLPLRLGAAIAYTESLFTVDKNLREARPTIMFCVPRLYESMSDKLLSAAEALDADKRAKYLDALELARKQGAVLGKLPGAPALGLIEKLKYKAYDAAVYSKIRERFGGRLRAFVSGGAPMAPEIGALFLGLGLTVCEGYGLTETSPVIAVNHPGRVHLGTVGEPMPSVEVKIEDDGEISVRGDSVFRGYWNKPEATAEVLQDGWFHTGDIGELSDGFLRITDRKKDLLVLANGKKVAPAPIELRLQQSRYIKQAVLLGDKQKSVTALIVPNFEAVRAFIKDSDPGAAAIATPDVELLADPRVVKLFRSQVDSHSGDLADFEKIRKIELLPREFSVEAGELTPTLKVKRRVVAEKYGKTE